MPKTSKTTNTELLLAGPGTGKTTRIKELIENAQPKNVLVLSFTNATIKDLLVSFEDTKFGVDEKNCMTLHRYSLLLNHLEGYQILDYADENIIKATAQSCGIPIDYLHNTLKCITFEKMITECVCYIDTNPSYAKDKIGDIDLFIVDEFQDFNESERNLIYKISEHANRTIILGDDDQSIYGFKDADATELIALYNNTDVKKINHENICYRCPDSVVNVASSLISHNKLRVDKPWKANGKKGKFYFNQLKNEEKTYSYLCNAIKKIHASSGTSKPSIMILTPVGFAVKGLSEVLTNEGINNLDWFGNKLGKDSSKDISYLRFALGGHKLLNLIIYSRNETLTPYKRRKLNILLKASFMDSFDERVVLEKIAASNVFSQQVNDDIIKLVTSEEILSRSQFDEYKEYFDSLETSKDMLYVLQRLSMLVASKLLVGESEITDVNIMSIHRSKGLQANYVFIVGLVNGICPNKNEGLSSYEAQRRLLFVGMTRARTSLVCVSTVEWNAADVNRVDKSQFKYNHKTKNYLAATSDFIGEAIGS